MTVRGATKVSDIKPCPKCKSENIKSDGIVILSISTYFECMKCRDCGFCGPYSDICRAVDISNAVEKWNAFIQPKQPTFEEVEAWMDSEMTHLAHEGVFYEEDVNLVLAALTKFGEK